MIQEVKNDLMKKESAKTALKNTIASKRNLLHEIKCKSSRLDKQAGELGGNISGKSNHLVKLTFEISQFEETLNSFRNNEHEFCLNNVAQGIQLMQI